MMSDFALEVQEEKNRLLDLTYQEQCLMEIGN
jgi:hypothetical protein